VRFLGFNTHVARTLIFATSCLFTGVAGALLAISKESSNYELFGPSNSANVVLQTFIGGAGTFFGPAFGAAIITFFARVTSDLTRSWLLYQGLIFVFVMLVVPEGLGGLISLHARRVKAGGWKHLAVPYLICLVAGVLLVAGIVYTVESIHVVMTDAYAAKRAAANGEWVSYQLFGHTFDPLSPFTWAIPIGLLAAGALLVPRAAEMMARAWVLATASQPKDAKGEAAAPSKAQGAAA
jgi:branched-chain amino acid transport system permease protein